MFCIFEIHRCQQDEILKNFAMEEQQRVIVCVGERHLSLSAVCSLFKYSYKVSDIFAL